MHTFKTLVIWIDGTHTVYTLQGNDKRDVEGQLIDNLFNVRDQIKSYSFERV